MNLEKWLENLNSEFRSNNIEQPKRPWEAIRRYSTEFKTSIDISSDLAKQIFDWFEKNSKPGVHKVGSLYEAIYLFDTQFWTVSIPIVYGQVELNSLDCLTEMPSHIKNQIHGNKDLIFDYVTFWADSVDYGLGVNDLKSDSNLDSYGKQLLLSGDQELRAATSILKQHRPDSRAILSSRMALEIFFKAYIALKVGLTDNQARKIGHDLNKGLSKLIEVSGYDHWESLRPLLSVFPEIRERYSEQDFSQEQLWQAYSFAHSVGALIVRDFTDRNTLEQVMASNN